MLTLPFQILTYNHRQNQLGRLYNLTVVHFNPEKREFSLLLYIPHPPCSMLGYNRTIVRTNINVLINIGPGVGGGRKRRGKKGNLPNTFDDDCSFVLMRTNLWQKLNRNLTEEENSSQCLKILMQITIEDENELAMTTDVP